MRRTSITYPILLAALLAAGQAYATQSVDELLQDARDRDADPKHGRDLFVQYCVECHGDRGQGKARRNIPVIANQRQAYIVKQFADIREQERAAPPMHGIMKQPALSDVQAWVDVAVYTNTLKPVTGVQVGNGKFLQLGEAMFREQCTSCHGEDARGDEDGFVPSLRNQHYTYLLDEIEALGGGHRSNVDPELIRFLNSLDQTERMGLADYLSRMQGKLRDLTWLRNNGVAGD
ncbi:MAG TPA: c-type cytochrome [Steroidobacteraceae bacterium]|nr:c-type cytochrome [Steroidobacteraceae bacterium]